MILSSSSSPHIIHLVGFTIYLLKSCSNIPFIMLSPETAGRRFVDQIFKAYEVSPHIVMEFSSSEEVKRMVELIWGRDHLQAFCR